MTRVHLRRQERDQLGAKLSIERKRGRDGENNDREQMMKGIKRHDKTQRANEKLNMCFDGEISAREYSNGFVASFTNKAPGDLNFMM